MTRSWATALVLCCWSVPVLAQNVLVDDRLQIEIWAVGLERPTNFAFIGEEDMLVCEKDSGHVERVIAGVVQPAPVLDAAVHWQSERGMLGIAVHPDFVHTQWVYLYYTESSTGDDTSDNASIPLGNRLYRYSWTGSTLVNPELLLDLDLSGGPHNGGSMRFGPDDKLYLVFGELGHGNSVGSAGQLQNNAAGIPPDSTGVVFRLNDDGSPPTDNPFYNPDDLDDPMNRIFAYGLRNSFGLAFDPESGSLWQSENGPEDYDEINRIFPGWNGGWMRIKGPVAADAEGESDLWIAPGAAYGDPQISFLGTTAPAGLEFVGSRVLGCELEHDLMMGDTNCRQLYKFELDAARENLVFSSPALLDRVVDNATDKCTHSELDEILWGPGPSWGPRIPDVKNGPDGYLYFSSLSQGEIKRIVPVSGMVADVDGDQVDDACDCSTADSGAFAVPGELPRLRLSGGAVAGLGWDDPRATTGFGTTHTLVTGVISQLRGDAGFVSTCTLGSGLATASATDGRPAAPDDGFYYLVRAGNSCGNGSFGSGRGPIDSILPGSCP